MRSVGPTNCHSSAAVSRGLPTSRFASLNDHMSAGPDGGNPCSQYPIRPGSSCTVVSSPGLRISSIGLFLSNGLQPGAIPGCRERLIVDQRVLVAAVGDFRFEVFVF